MPGARSKANEVQPFSGQETVVPSILLDSDGYQKLFSLLPVAVAVSRGAGDDQRIDYANAAFLALTHQPVDALIGGRWNLLDSFQPCVDGATTIGLGRDIATGATAMGTYRCSFDGSDTIVQAQINHVRNGRVDDYTLVTLTDVGHYADTVSEQAKAKINERDMLMRELQHRVKNNLQLVTALVRLEARGAVDREATALRRIADRVDAVSLLYRKLSAEGATSQVDLGEYLDDIACALMESSARSNISLELDIERFEADLNITMLIGLLVNELLTNALKHAFIGEAGGKLTLTCRKKGRRALISVSDNGIGLAEGQIWPPPRKLGALILQAMHDHAENIDFKACSEPGRGARFQLEFDLGCSD